MFEKATSLDPGYAEAYATLAFVHFETYLWQWDAYPDALDHAEEFADKAITLDSSNARAYATRGWIAALRNRRSDAIADGERAVALEPSNSFACAALADILNLANRHQEALVYAQKGMRLDPHHPAGFMNEAGFAYSGMGRFQQSINALKNGVAGNPWVHAVLFHDYVRLGRMQEARAEAAEVHRLAPKFSLETVSKRMPGWDNSASQRDLDDLKKSERK
jgi:adenylate cyclase